MAYLSQLLQSPIEYLKGVGPVRGELLREELGISTFYDLLVDYPFRHEDRTAFQKINKIRVGETVQLIGQFVTMSESGFKNSRRLTAKFQDDSGGIEVIWFRGTKWIQQNVRTMVPYVLYGKVTRFKGKKNIAHPELEAYGDHIKERAGMHPVYRSTEKLTAKGLDAKGRRKLMENLLAKVSERDLPENLPLYLVNKLRFPSRFEAVRQMHMPTDNKSLAGAQKRVSFEELFFSQLELIAVKLQRKQHIRGEVFGQVGEYFHGFYEKNLPFELTGAQKRVMREIRSDLGSGVQMNRLLQGDVGSGKTIIAIMAMLIAIDNGYQAAMLAPTEILANQHFQSVQEYVKGLGLRTAFLSGSVKGTKRKAILQGLRNGHIHILVGTHAILEDTVVFRNLGLSITDEQHRFGVAQRAKLWAKGKDLAPHILVMTATPIPRTLAMTMYGDLDVSIIDELPPGRKPVRTTHRREIHRPKVNTFLREEIAKGRQVYIIFPLIEESEKLDLENLQQGYDRLLEWFPRPEYQISVVHGRMKAADKDFEMDRFVKKQTQIMVATTVIEVGVNVPNASVMLIENAERFGLSQLHQLRGRVGRGADQSYCILMSGNKLSNEARERIDTMCRTNNGFEIAEADLRLRGPGDLTGTRQSGAMEFKTANLARDYELLRTANIIAQRILEDDPALKKDINKPLRDYLSTSPHLYKEWHRIS